MDLYEENEEETQFERDQRTQAERYAEAVSNMKERYAEVLVEFKEVATISGVPVTFRIVPKSKNYHQHRRGGGPTLFNWQRGLDEIFNNARGHPHHFKKAYFNIQQPFYGDERDEEVRAAIDETCQRLNLKIDRITYGGDTKDLQRRINALEKKVEIAQNKVETASKKISELRYQNNQYQDDVNRHQQTIRDLRAKLRSIDQEGSLDEKLD